MPYGLWILVIVLGLVTATSEFAASILLRSGWFFSNPTKWRRTWLWRFPGWPPGYSLAGFTVAAIGWAMFVVGMFNDRAVGTVEGWSVAVLGTAILVFLFLGLFRYWRHRSGGGRLRTIQVWRHDRP